MTNTEKELEKDYERYMQIALEEASKSLREGNNGFGAVIIILKNGEIVAKARDAENTSSDPTAHAELNAIHIASKKLGKDLSECILVSTHEPCPMCSTALIWAKIQGIVYSVSIKEALKLGRTRIDLPCEELIERANAMIWVKKGVLKEKCITLYKSKRDKKPF
jgi:tRNA(Arg) A34 adenosine deaminase TadA